MFKARTLPTLHKTQNEQINKQTRIVIRYCENLTKKDFMGAAVWGKARKFKPLKKAFFGLIHSLKGNKKGFTLSKLSAKFKA